MAKQMFKALSMLMLVATLALAAVVSAQTPRRVVATIPFDFTVGNKEMPAGTYGVQQTTGGSDILKIAGTDNSNVIVRLSSPLQRSDTKQGKLVFHRYEDRYFLAEIWAAGESKGRKLFKSSQERSLEHQLASNSSQQTYQRVEIALADK